MLSHFLGSVNPVGERNKFLPCTSPEKVNICLLVIALTLRTPPNALKVIKKQLVS